MFILYAIPIGIVAGYLLGGRLDASRRAAAPLGAARSLLGLLLQVAIFSDAIGRAVGDAGPAIYVASSRDRVSSRSCATSRIPGDGARRDRGRLQPRRDRRQRRLDAGRPGTRSRRSVASARATPTASWSRTPRSAR